MSHACFFHVPEPISYLPATDSGLPQSPCACFLMSRRRYPAFLPQILPCHNPLLFVFSCPGADILPFCHSFRLGIAPCACFFHVPEPISCFSATVSALPQSPFACFLMSRRLYPTVLPQISARLSYLCLLFSYPGADILPFCHSFWLATIPL